MPYQAAYGDLFDTKRGAKALKATRAVATAAAEEFSSGDAITRVCEMIGCVDSWDVLNSLDHLVTLGEIRELTDREKVRGQDRRYISERGVA